MDKIAYLWIGAIVLFAAIEASTVTLVSVWFIGGALAALIASLLGGPLWLQIALFFVVSAALLALLRPLLRKYIMPKKEATNADRLIGQEALVCEDVCNLKETGAVRIGGVEWTARSETGDDIPKGTKIQITRIAGAKIFVAPAEVASAAK